MSWLGIVLGNTHHYWGSFIQDNLTHVHRFLANEAPDLPLNQDIWLAQVAPTPISIPPQVRSLTLKDVPLANLYPGLGLDRALALLAAERKYGSPVLVIDAGTALTLSGLDPERCFAGGAILPGLGSQIRALHEYTHLPLVSYDDLPTSRWAQTTVTAIQSGVLFSLQAGLRSFCQDWQTQFSTTSIVLTGGDGAKVARLLEGIGIPIYQDPYLVLCGIQQCRNQILLNSC
jgi:type III pantothenate kinase